MAQNLLVYHHSTGRLKDRSPENSLTWILSLNFLMPENALSAFRAWILTLLSLSSSISATKLMSSIVQVEEAYSVCEERRERQEKRVSWAPLSPKTLEAFFFFFDATHQRDRSEDAA